MGCSNELHKEMFRRGIMGATRDGGNEFRSLRENFPQYTHHVDIVPALSEAVLLAGNGVFLLPQVSDGVGLCAREIISVGHLGFRISGFQFFSQVIVREVVRAMSAGFSSVLRFFPEVLKFQFFSQFIAREVVRAMSAGFSSVLRFFPEILKFQDFSQFIIAREVV